MKQCVLTTIVIAVNLLVPAMVSCQERWPVSAELGYGRGKGHTSGLYKSNDSGITADALISVTIAELRQGRIVAATGIGVQGAGNVTSECILTPDGNCISSFPEFTVAAALVGWETANTILRILAGPAYVLSGEKGIAMQGRVNLFVPVTGRLAVGASLRGSLIPSYEGESFRIGSAEFVLRLR